jgi:uncharacterized protein (DUF934 family)
MTIINNACEVIADDWIRYDRFQLGVELEVTVDIEEIRDWLPRLDLVILNFDSFADGRAFSQARLLRERYGYDGDIRAQGEVLRDQLSFMQRCGINQFSLVENEDQALALNSFSDISKNYQPELRQG